MRADWSDGNPDKVANYKILRCSHPAILTESGFYTNKEECEFMLSNEGKDLISTLHVNAIEKYVNWYNRK